MAGGGQGNIGSSIYCKSFNNNLMYINNIDIVQVSVNN